MNACREEGSSAPQSCSTRSQESPLLPLLPLPSRTELEEASKA